MAIALQNAPVTLDDDLLTTTPTISVTVSAGTDRILVFVFNGEGNGSGSRPAFLSGVTFGGVALTMLDQAAPAAPAWSQMEIWYLINPAVSTANLVATYSTNMFGVSHRVMGAYVFTGVHQTTPFRTPAKSTGNGTSVSNTVTGVVASDLIVDGLTVDAPGHSVVVGANQTERWKLSSPGSDGVSSTQSGADGGVMSHSWTTAGDYSHIAAAMIQSGPSVDATRPDADVTTTGWTATPLFSKINDSSDATVVQGTAS